MANLISGPQLSDVTLTSDQGGTPSDDSSAGPGDDGVDATSTPGFLGIVHGWRGLRMALNDWVTDNGSVTPALMIADDTTGSTSSPFEAVPSGPVVLPGTPVETTSPILTTFPARSTAVAVGLSGPPDPQTPLDGGNAGWMILTTQDQASAQVLPFQAHVGVFGTVNAAVPSRVFEILSSPRTRNLAIVLSQTSGTDPVEMALYDSSGRQLANSEVGTGPSRREVSMNVPADQLSQSSGVYVKIATPPLLAGSSSSGSETGSDSFVLEVTRDPEVGWPSDSLAQFLTPHAHLGDGSSSLATGIPASAFEKGWESAATEPSDPAQTELALGASLVVTPASSGQSPLSSPVVATGPLPERAGAPLGGVLAEGDPVPQIDRHDPALIDLALIGLPELEPLPGAGEANLEAVATELQATSGDARGLVAIRGPGGSTLLAASLHGQRAPASDALLAVLPAATATLAKSEPAGESIPVEATVQQRQRPIRTASMLSGVTVAMAMVFSLLLPDATRLMTIVEASRFRFRFRRRDRV